jgi:hypothetical protein
MSSDGLRKASVERRHQLLDHGPIPSTQFPHCIDVSSRGFETGLDNLQAGNDCSVEVDIVCMYRSI